MEYAFEGQFGIMEKSCIHGDVGIFFTSPEQGGCPSPSHHPDSGLPDVRIPYCLNAHTAAAQKLGVDAETLGEVMAIASLFNRTNALADGFQVLPDVRPAWDADQA